MAEDAAPPFLSVPTDRPHDGTGSQWCDLPFSLLPPDRPTAWEWALVLAARDIPVRVRTERGRHILQTLPEFLNRALEEISAYEDENRSTPAPPPEPAPYGNTDSSLLVLTALFVFHVITLNHWKFLGYNAALAPLDWQGLGAADCWDCLLNNEWWRFITALTLHADWAHLFANLVIGGVLLVPICRELGAGTGWFLILLAGTLGNSLNCRIQGPQHISVGASTAIFGGVGALAALRTARDALAGRLHWRTLLPPLGAGLALTALLGTGGGRTDVGAHLMGFASGLFFGGLAGLLVARYGVPGKACNRLLGAAALFLVAGAWILALRTG